MRELARRLVAANPITSAQNVHEATLVNPNLRNSLIQLCGAEGFAALLRRALVLARGQVPALRSVKVSAEGRLDGIEQLATQSVAAREAAAIVVTAHILELLVVFIGKGFARRLVREACPDTSLVE